MHRLANWLLFRGRKMKTLMSSIADGKLIMPKKLDFSGLNECSPCACTKFITCTSICVEGKLERVRPDFEVYVFFHRWE